MGYQNNTRPKKIKLLEADVLFDFNDLLYDVENNHLNDIQLIEAISFMGETYRILSKKIYKKKKKLKKKNKK